MPKKKSPEAFFERARENGSEEKTGTVSGEEVKKELQRKTELNYERALALWRQYEALHPGASPYDIEASKDFVRNLALGIEGSYGLIKPGLWTVVQYYKDFTAAWRRDGNDPISPNVTLSTSNYIKYILYQELGLHYRKRLRRYGTMIHFLHLGTQLWKNDWFTFQRPGRRVKIWALIMACVFSSSRIGEYIESTCRLGTRRGLYYKDMIFGVFRNENGDAEIAVQLKRDAKAMTFTPDKRPEHALHEGLEPRPLFCNPMLVFLSIFIAEDALRDYKSVNEVLELQPPEEEMVQIHWNPRVLDLPFFKGNTGEMETATAFGRYLRELGLRTGYITPPTVHDFRAEGLFLVDKHYSSSARMKHGGHKDENVFRNYYEPNNAGTDGQGSYFGGKELRTIVADRFRAMGLSRNPELWQSLPAEKRHELENKPEFMAIEAELETLSLDTKDDLEMRNKRKELQTQKRRLVSEELRKCQEAQATKPASKTGSNGPEWTGHHRTIFQRVRKLMPERDRLASSLFAVAPIRSEEGLAALRDLIELCRQEHEIAFRPGLEPEKCCCPKTVRKIDSKPAAERWRHIYGCYRKRLLVTHDFAELCFLCSEWVTSRDGWETHCQTHLDEPKTIPTQCNPLVYGGTLCSPGFCPFCLGNASTPALRMRQFLDRTEWKDHVHKHLDDLEDTKAPICPLRQLHCTEAFPSLQDLKFHLQDIHCLDLSMTPKRPSPADGTGSRSAKRQRPNRKSIKVEDLKYEFVDESDRVCIQYKSVKPTPTPSSSGLSTPVSEFETEQNQSDDKTSVTSRCSQQCIDKRDWPAGGPPAAQNESMIMGTAESGAEKELTKVSLDPVLDSFRCEVASQTRLTKCSDTYQSLNLANREFSCPAAVEPEGDRYAVEKLLEKRVRRFRGGKIVTKYLVKWEGYPDEENTWVNEEDIDKDLIEEYEEGNY